MLPVRVARRRTAAAVATVLAVTLGAGALTVPAAVADSAPGTAAAGAEAREAVPRMPVNHVIEAGGGAGFFSTYFGDPGGVVWTSYEGGTTGLPAGSYLMAAGGDLYVDELSKNVVDMASGARYRLPENNDRAVGIAGPYAFTALTLDSTSTSTSTSTSASDTGTVTGSVPGTTLWAHTAQGARLITGLPAGAGEFEVRPGTAEHGVVAFTGADGARYHGLVDLEAGKVTETYRTPADDRFTVSDTRVAWVEDDVSGIDRAVVVTRGAPAERKLVELGPAGSRPVIGLVGDWLLDGVAPRFAKKTTPYPGLRARSLTDATAAPVELLDRFTELVPDGSGGMLAGGGRLGTGDGAYRVAADADGKPSAAFVAANGSPTETAESKPASVPTGTVNLDDVRFVPFHWYLNHWDSKVTVRLRHVRTGRTYDWVMDGYDEAGGWDSDYRQGFPFGPSWSGTLGDGNRYGGPDTRMAYNGAYTWEMTAEPWTGVGPALKRSGSFTVTRSAKPHDFDDDGAPDLLARDASGVLWSDTGFRDSRYRSEVDVPKTRIGGGWQIYDRVEATGPIAGSAHADVVARDKAGVLWLYQGNGLGGFARRVQVGGGWQTYDRLTGGSDFTGDGRPDLLAADKTGVLWLYKATGSAAKPFEPRKRIGSGWGVYNQLTATGDIAGAAPGDLVARDKDGVLWMYLGKGDGTFTRRSLIGGGFGRYGELVGAGDYDSDGKNDLLAYESATGRTYYFSGTGGRDVPFLLARVSTTLYGAGSYNLFG
ncbi:FG-GAP repeat domain-containing protein [Streptomyces sp. NPDC014773]|uniref:FG-GAP repeat domain-containing protein n=1 Tax=Streptomyces sp. NPDC014773 TaxID=3364908 RepID=UPI0036F8266B